MAKYNDRFSTNLRAIALLTGTTIGAGVLGIPYVVAKTGFLTGILYLLGIGVVLMVLHLMLGEVTLRTKRYRHLPGYAEKYLGKRAKHTMFIANMLLIYGALSAYMIGAGEALAEITPFSPYFISLGFFVIRGIKAVTQVELVFVIGMVTMILSLAMLAVGGGYIQPEFYTTESTFADFGLPFGVIVFSYFSLTTVPELRQVLGKYRKDLDNVIVIGAAIPILLYLIFTATVIGVVGENVAEVATVSLGRILGPGVNTIVNIFATSSMFTSFLALGSALTHMYTQDYKVHRERAVWFTLLPPLALVIFGANSFVAMLSFSGAVSGTVVTALVVAMYWRAKEKSMRAPEFSLGEMLIGGVAIVIFMVIGVMWQFLL
jgi:tyrosine-specific transport protein